MRLPTHRPARSGRRIRRTYSVGLTLGVALATILNMGIASAAGSGHGSKGKFPDVTLKVADFMPSTDAWSQWVTSVAKHVAKDTHNHVKINIYPNGELASEPGTLSGVQTDAFSMGLSTPQIEDTIAKGIDVDFLPAFVSTKAQAEALARSDEVRQIENQALAPHNVRIVGSCFTGFVIFISKIPLPTVKSFSGVKFRVPDPGNAAMVSALGGSGQVLPISETYTAIELGTVQGTPTTLPTILANEFYEVAKYVDLTPVDAEFEDLVINTKAYSELSSAEQTILQHDAVSSSDHCADLAQKISNKGSKMMKSQGVTFVGPAKNYAPFAKALAPVTKQGETVSPLAVKLTKAEKTVLKNMTKADKSTKASKSTKATDRQRPS